MATKMKSVSRIAILSKIPNLLMEVVKRCPEIEEKIVNLSNETNVISSTYKKEIGTTLQNSDVIVADPSLLVPYLDEVCSGNSKVQWIQSTWAGVEVLIKEATACKVKPSFCLTRFAGTSGQHMAEYVVGHIVAWERDFQTAWKSQMKHCWNLNLAKKQYRLLNDLTIGVLGVGGIGKAVCKGCKQMGMKVFGMVSTLPSPDKLYPFVDKYFLTKDIENLLSESDFVCNTLPKTPETDGLLSGCTLKACATKNSVLINIGRGNVINDGEIVHAVKQGWIKGAILDVFQEEPLPKSSPLWDLNEVVITPHCSALSFGHEVASLFVENLDLFQTGDVLKFVVNWQKGY